MNLFNLVNYLVYDVTEALWYYANEISWTVDCNYYLIVHRGKVNKY